MNIDESLLSAYLDDELAPPERAAVEAALAADAGLALRLAELGRVRDLLATLPRPAAPAFDAAPAVLAAIAARRGREATVRLAGSWTVVVGLAAAAALLLATTLVRPRPADPSVSFRGGDAIAARPAPARPAEDRPEPEIGAEAKPDPPAAELAQADPAPAPEADDVRSPEDLEREAVRALLGRPDVRRIVLVADEIDPGIRDRVDRAVRRAAGLDGGYRRVSVGPGIVVDPARPNEAEVFVLVLDDDDLDRFDLDLRREMADRAEVARSDPEPAVLAELARVGSIRVLPGEPMPRLRPFEGPDPALALRIAGRQAQPAEADPAEGQAPGREPDAPAPAGRPGPEGEPAPGDLPNPAEPNRRVVLVWLTPREGRGPGIMP